MSTLLNAISVLVPVLFVMALGFWAGRAKKVETAGNTLVKMIV